MQQRVAPVADMRWQDVPWVAALILADLADMSAAAAVATVTARAMATVIATAAIMDATAITTTTMAAAIIQAQLSSAA